MRKGFLIVFILVYAVLLASAENPALDTYKGTRGNGLNFTPNRGQIVDAGNNLRPDILFVGDGGGAKVYLRKTGISYVISNAGKILGAFRKKHKGEIKLKSFDKNFQKLKEAYLKEHPVTLQRIDVDFEGANENFTVLNDEETEGYTNYYYPHCKDGITNIKAYNKITYKNIYDGIDIVFYGNKSNGLKYDIIVKPGADPNKIKLLYSGANALHLNGNVVEIKTEIFTMKDYMPLVYQNINGDQKNVKTTYNLKKLKHKKYEVSYELSNYDKSSTLIIDPYNYWITYYGGSAADYPNDICNDKNGDVLVTGYTSSIDFPISVGAYQTLADTFNIFILKMSSSGNRLWSTFYGKVYNDLWNMSSISSISNDNFNNVYVAGCTNSGSFPVSSGCYQNALGGNQDAFLLKFNSGGTRVWATFFGGTANEEGMSVVCNSLNEPIIVGTVDTSNFIVTSNVIQSTYGGGTDGFVSKFSPAGNLIWSTFYGGSGYDQPFRVKTDAFNNIIFSGQTCSSNYPVSTGCSQNQLKGYGDGFVTKLNSAGNALIFSTYFGGTDQGSFPGQYWMEYIHTIDIDSKNNILALGVTSANDIYVSGGAFQTTFGGGLADNFIVKFNPAGSINWSTYYGNAYWEFAGGIKTDNKDNVLVLSEWEDDAFVNMQVLGCAYQKVFGGTEDQFFIKFDSTGNYKCLTYLGGPSEDDCDVTYNGLSYYNGSFFYTVVTLGSGYPITQNGYQQIPGDTIGWGGGDLIIGKLCATSCGDTSNSQPDFIYSSQYCNPAPTQFYGVAAPCDTEGVRYQWYFIGGTPATSTQLNPVSSFATPGNHTVKFVVITPCGNDSIVKNINLVVASNCNLQANMSGGNVCPGSCTNVQVTPSGGVPPYTYVWTPNIGNGPGPYHVCPTTNTIFSVTVTDSQNNQTNVTQTVNVTTPVTFTAGASPTVAVAPVSVTFTALPTGGGIHYHWQCEDHFNTTQGSYTYNFDTAGVYTIYVVSTDANGCQSGDTLYVTVTEPVVLPVSSLEVPNIFTPNNNGANDYFFVHTKNITTLSVLIFNRWGQKVCEFDNASDVWDGRSLKGEPCSEGTYYYILNATGVDNKEYKQKGFITLVR